MAASFSTQQLIPWLHTRATTQTVVGLSVPAYPPLAAMPGSTVTLPIADFMDLVWRAKSWDLSLSASLATFPSGSVSGTVTCTANSTTRHDADTINPVTNPSFADSALGEPVRKQRGLSRRRRLSGVVTSGAADFLPGWKIRCSDSLPVAQTITHATLDGVTASTTLAASITMPPGDPLSLSFNLSFTACRFNSDGTVTVGVVCTLSVSDSVAAIIRLAADPAGSDSITLFGRAVPATFYGDTGSLSLDMTPTSWWF